MSYKVRGLNQLQFTGNKQDFIQFVAEQFKQINRKRLSLPIKLYQL